MDGKAGSMYGGEFGDQIAIKAIFSVPIGEAIMKEWTRAEIWSYQVPDLFFKKDPPWWLEDAEFYWPGPLEAMEFYGRVKRGYESHAREALEQTMASDNTRKTG